MLSLVLVVTVEFIGNHDVKSDDLRDAMDRPLADPIAPDDEGLEYDLLLLSAYYWDHGYANVRIGEPVIDPKRNAVTIPITEGPVFTMGPIVATGDLIGSAKKNLAMMKIRAGQRFSRTIIANDREALATYYEDMGYAYVNVLPLTKVDIAAKTIGLTFEVTKGKLTYIEKVNIFNASKTSTDKLEKTLGLTAQTLYSSTALLDGKKRVAALPFITDVIVSTKHGSSDELVEINVEVSD